MPYIDDKERSQYKDILDKLPDIKTKGDLEYCIFYMMRRNFMRSRDYRYSHLHDCVYAAQHCADEFRRRFLDKREDEAMIKNGDI
ncbi:MAG: hypothetical protein QXG00_06565 [Candidatus Woesearchaeota archaeon]